MMGKSRKSGRGIGEIGSKRSGKKRFERVERVFADEKREEAGAATRAGLEKAFDAMSDWVCLMDTKWRILWSNSAGERFTGLGTEEMVGQLCCKLVHGSDKPLAECPLKKMLKTGRRESIELQVPGIDRWLMVTVDPVKDGKGKVTGAVHIVRDITEEKRAEAALQESEENYRLLFESSAVGVGVSLPDGRILAANERIQQIMGYSLEEFKKVNIADVYANVEERKRLLEILKRDGRVKNYEARLKRKNGEVYWASLSINKAEVRGEERLLTTQIDITRRKEAEETLRESEERFRQVVENSQEWIWEVDANGLYIYASPVAEKVFGYKPEEIIGKKHFYDLFHPEDRKELKKQAFAVFAKKQAFRGFINRNVHKNGQTIWLSTSGIPVLDERENLLGYRGADADITERKRAEEVLVKERNLLDALISTIPDHIYCKDRQGRFVRGNEATARDFGLRDAKSLVGRNDFDFFAPEHARRLREEEERVMQTGKPLVNKEEEGEEGILRGIERIWTLNTKTPWRDSAGSIIGVVGVNRDITQRRRAEEALRASEEHLRSLIENIPTVCWESDRQGNTVFISANVEQVYGYTPQEIYDRADELWFGRIHPDDRQRVRKAFDSLFAENKPYDIKYRIRKRDGNWIWLHDKAGKIYEEDGIVYACGAFLDVTERRRAEEALRGERNLLRTVIDNLPDEVYVKDSESKFVLYNKTVAEHQGAASTDELVGKSDFDLYPRDIAEQYYADEQQIIRSGRARDNYLYAGTNKKDGKEILGRNTKMPLRDGEGAIVGLVGIGHNVTEQKKVQDALEAERNLLRTVIDNLPDRVYVKDNESRFVLCNEAVVRHEGQSSADDVVGKTDFDFYPRELAEQFLAEERRVMESGEPLINREGVSRDAADEESCVLTTKVPLRDSSGKPMGIVGINRDITERKRAEEKLRENEMRFRGLFEHISSGVAVYEAVDDGKDFVFRDFNKAAEKIEDVKRDDVIDRPVTEVFPGVRDFGLFDVFHRVWRTGRAEHHPVSLYKDGRISHWAENYVYKLPSGEIVAVYDDITERKRTEEKLLEYHGRLKRLASQLTLAEERQRRRIAGELHDTVSQSLALAKIKVDALRAGATSQEPKEVLAEVAESLGEAISKTRSLTFDLSYPILYELGFEAAVEEWLEENVGRRYGIKTEFYDDGSEKLLDDDVRVLLFRNVRELLTNVVKHSNAKQVQVSVRKIDDEIQVAVKDNGVGFDVEQQSATAGRSAEFGLLSIRERLEDIGGKLEIESSPGGGCTVTMTVPVNNNSN